MAGTLRRGDVRLCRFLPPDRERPVVVLTRDSAIGLLATVTFAPITSTIRGVPSEVMLDVEDGLRLGRLVANLSDQRMQPVCGPEFRAGLRLTFPAPLRPLFATPIRSATSI